MKKVFKRVIATGLAAAMAAAMVGCSGGSGSADAASSLEGSNVRVVIGSTSTSGDSYMIAELVTRYLSAEMGFNGKVDAIGNASALDEIKNAKGDGKTVLMSHDITYMSVLFGAVDEMYSLENMTIGPRIGQNPGGCFGAAAEDNWNSLADVTQYLIDNPSETVSFNIESGGTSHICFIAYYLWAQETYGDELASRIKAIVGGTTAEKLQRLWDRNADVIYGDTSAFEQYTQAEVDDQLRMTMFGSCDEVTGVEITSMAAEGVTYGGEPFVFSKDFAMYFPKDMDEDVLAEYEAAMKSVTENSEFQEEMAALYYKSLSADEVALAASQEFITSKRDTCSEIIANAPSLDSLT